MVFEENGGKTPPQGTEQGLETLELSLLTGVRRLGGCLSLASGGKARVAGEHPVIHRPFSHNKDLWGPVVNS